MRKLLTNSKRSLHNPQALCCSILTTKLNLSSLSVDNSKAVKDEEKNLENLI